MRFKFYCTELNLLLNRTSSFSCLDVLYTPRQRVGGGSARSWSCYQQRARAVRHLELASGVNARGSDANFVVFVETSNRQMLRRVLSDDMSHMLGGCKHTRTHTHTHTHTDGDGQSERDRAGRRQLLLQAAKMSLAADYLHGNTTGKITSSSSCRSVLRLCITSAEDKTSLSRTSSNFTVSLENKI